VPDAWKLIKAIQELKADIDNLAASLKARRGTPKDHGSVLVAPCDLL
jgi:hypothetical protein